MKNKKRKRKNCPTCKYFNNKKPVCIKNPERDVYTIHTIPDKSSEREWCTDFMRKK
jgi:hypothetical protein